MLINEKTMQNKSNAVTDRIATVFAKIDDFHTDYIAKKAYYETNLKLLADITEQIKTMDTLSAKYDKAIVELTKISTDKALTAKEELEKVLNWALSNIEMEQNYSAEIVEIVRGQSRGIQIVLYDTDSGYPRSVDEQSGTALAQMISFLMLAIVIKFSGCSRIMILDEVFSGVDDVNTVRMFGEILVALAKNEGFQFIYVEHQNLLDEILGMNVIDVVQTKYDEGTVVRSQYTVQDNEQI